MIEWLLIAITVLTASGQPIHGAWVACESMWWTSSYYEEQTTDSRGRFIVIVPPHACTASKEGAVVSFAVDGDDVEVVLDARL